MLFFQFLSKLPFGILYGISNFACFILYRVFGYRKKVVFENLRNSFPNKSVEEIEEIAQKFYQHLSDIFVEFFKGLSISKAEIQKRAKIMNVTVLTQFIEKDMPVILVTGHQGNWEWTLHALTLTGVEMDVVYQKLSSPFFDKLTYKIRARFGTHLIEKNDSIRATIERNTIPRALCLAADQIPSNWKTAYWTNFLHQDSAFFTGTERIARKFDYPVIFMELKRVKRGFYEIEFHEIARPPYSQVAGGEILERFIKRLDDSIQQNPVSYLWSHRRWKHKRTVNDVIRPNFRELKTRE